MFGFQRPHLFIVFNRLLLSFVDVLPHDGWPGYGEGLERDAGAGGVGALRCVVTERAPSWRTAEVDRHKPSS